MNLQENIQRIKEVMQINNPIEGESDVLSQELGGLTEKKFKRYPWSFFMVNDENVIKLEIDKYGYLWASSDILNNVSKKLSLDINDSKIEIKKWVAKHFKLPSKRKKIDKEEEDEGVGGYAAPAFEMKPDHEHFKRLYNEDVSNINDDDYSEELLNVIKKLVGSMDLPKLVRYDVVWDDMKDSYKIRLYYNQDIDNNTRWTNESNVIRFVRPFLDLPLYSIEVWSYYVDSPTKFVSF